MLWVLLSLFAGAAVASLLVRAARHYAGMLLSLLPLGIVAWSSQHWPSITAGIPYHQSFAWAPSLGVAASFNLDGLSLLFLLLICGIGALVLVYASGYLRGDQRLGLFFTYLLVFMGSMLGLVLADNMILVFVFWELTSISSFLLIGWNHDSAETREAARRALVVTGGGGMMLLGGLVLLVMIGGETEISRLDGATLRESDFYLLALMLVLAGAFTKSAQFPLHFWLPGAMAAPTPVSAYLHSATMVKAGVYLLARMQPALGQTQTWFVVVTAVGGLTMVVGAAVAVTQTDLKRILAYSTVSVLGMLTMLIGIGTEEAIAAAVTYLLAHSLYKGALFLIAGILDHEAGSREIGELRGLAGRMPLTASAATLAAASSAGVPLLFGFVAKELLYEATWHAPLAGVLMLVGGFFASALMVVVALLITAGPFFSGPMTAPRPPHEAPWTLALGPLVLAAASLMLGVVPGMASGLIGAAATASFGEAMPTELAVWHGWTPVLGLSVLTLVVGTLLHYGGFIDRVGNRIAARWMVDAQHIYDISFSGVMRGADRITRTVQNGYLRNYVLIVIITLLVLLTPPVLEGHRWLRIELTEIHLFETILGLVILLAAVSVTWIDSRLAVAAALGVIGIAVMTLYVVFGALDLAVTQIMVETLTVILLVLVLYHLPRFRYPSLRWVYMRDGVISVAFGAIIAILVIKAFAVHADPELREYYASHAFTEAHGRNVVNVILVDFRATDTMGEATVLAAAAIGVLALLRLRAGGKRDRGAMISLVLRAATPVLMLLLLVVSIYALLRGHHESGGGFTGGLLAAAAFSLHALAHNVQSTRRLLGVSPRTLMGVGLALMALAGLAGLGRGGSFLESQWMTASLPGLRTVHLGTPLLFDLGVYAVVFGMVLTIVLTAAEE